LALLATKPAWFSRLRHLAETHYRVALFGLCLTAATLSFGYVAFYLRGGPRIIDATAYLLQARGFASGHLTLPTLEPSASLRGRFLYFSPELRHLSVLFPPGYPAVLALSILLGSPWLLGAALAAALVWMTAKLTLRLFDDKTAALFAAILSTINACLRYHTADTMSHGLCALLVVTALYGAFGSRRRDALLSGFVLGWLVATRPVTALAIGFVIAIRWLVVERSLRSLGLITLGLIPGTLLWLGYQWVSTGSPWFSTQYAYYAVADGPPGCFRYGFGQGIGCLFEHGSYVAKRLPHGYGLWQAVYVTLLRLRWHALDVLNVELLFPVVIWALALAARRPHLKYVAWSIVAVVLAYLPFYFDASYPGGGARLFVDVVALEQVLVAGLFVHHGIGRWLVSMSLAGFAFHGVFEHRQLMERDGGRPMFEPHVLDAQGIAHGLVFVDTDHGFLLGHEPAVTDVNRGRVVVRRRGDAHDRLLWERLGRPPTFRYHFDPGAHESRGSVVPLSPGQLNSLFGFEAEAEWPPWRVDAGWVLPVYPPNDCTSAQRGLSLEPVNGKSIVTLALPVEHAGVYRLRVNWVARRSGRQTATLSLAQRQFDVDRDALTHQCFETIHEGLRLDSGELPMTIESGPLGLVIDRYRLED
jgi:hypothetical protein